MKFFIANLFFSLLFSQVYAASENDNLLNQLKKEVAKKSDYDRQKLLRINQIKSDLKQHRGSDFSNYLKLFDEYEYYKFDSAYFYGKKLLEHSLQINDQVKVNESKVKIGSLLLHAGLFKETFDYLSEIEENRLDKKYKYDFFCLKSGAYSNLAIYNNDPNFTKDYNKKAIEYLDSAIAISKPNSLNQLFALANRQVISGEVNQPPLYFLKLLQNFQLTAHQRARLLAGLAAFYNHDNQSEKRINLLAESAINDIRSSTRETLATLLLAEALFKQGKLDDAYLFIKLSRADAGFYGNRLRKLKIESIMPDISTQINLVTQRDKHRFLICFLFISFAAIVILLVLMVIFLQLKKLKVKERIIQEKNQELKVINEQLLLINDKLREYATVNEKYIGYFFNVISGYILKLDRLKKNVERKIFAKRYSEILPSLNDINIKKEREILFNTFDTVFISIFPNFIDVFNSLLNKEDQIWPKDPELLNTDLRIYALIRLGINDVEAIAAILEYSVNTIYVYKMRIKAKALVSGDVFDSTIMAVKAV